MTEVVKEAETGMAPGLTARHFRQSRDAQRMLDLGCGLGEFRRYRSTKNLEVYCVDLGAGCWPSVHVNLIRGFSIYI